MCKANRAQSSELKPKTLFVCQTHSALSPSSIMHHSLAFVCVWVEGMLMRVLGVPPLTGDTRRRLIDFPTVILPAATKTVGREAGALAYLNTRLGWWKRASWGGIKLAGQLWTTQS